MVIALVESLISRMDDAFLSAGVTSTERIAAIKAVLDLIGPLSVKVSTPAADGAADMDAGLILLGSGIDITGVTPNRAGQILVIWEIARQLGVSTSANGKVLQSREKSNST